MMIIWIKFARTCSNLAWGKPLGETAPNFNWMQLLSDFIAKENNTAKFCEKPVRNSNLKLPNGRSVKPETKLQINRKTRIVKFKTQTHLKSVIYSDRFKNQNGILELSTFAIQKNLF